MLFSRSDVKYTLRQLANNPGFALLSVLVLAGAGTGKTAALTSRLAHLIATRRAWPSEILAVTFTNKAAREMRERVGRIVGPAVEGMPWLGTFHSIGAKMLRRHAELVGLKSNFTILDTDDQLRLLKQLILASDIDEKRWPARHLASLIDRWKNKGWTPKDVDSGEAESFAHGKGADLYRQYQDRLRALNACDFGDLLLHMLPDAGRIQEPEVRLEVALDVLEQHAREVLVVRVPARGPVAVEGEAESRRMYLLTHRFNSFRRRR